MDKLFSQFNKPPLSTAWKLITPPYQFAWETLFLLSIFSCLMAAISTGIVKFGISVSGFMFLVLGTAWYLNEKPIKFFGLPLAHWVPGGLISYMLFGSWFWVSPFWLIVSLPISAALVAIVAEFISPHLKLKKTDTSGYQRIIITSLSYLIVSCWVTFGFTLHQWLDRYPSLMAVNEFNSVRHSNFVVRLDLSVIAPTIAPAPTSKAENLLKQAETIVKTTIHGKLWGEVVQPWANTVSQNPSILQDSLRLDQTEVPEAKLWKVETRIARQDEGYDLYLLAIWKGPSTDPAGYYMTKSCKVLPKQRQTPKPSAISNQSSSNQSSTERAVSGQATSPFGGSRLGETIGILTCEEVSKPISVSTPPSI